MLEQDGGARWTTRAGDRNRQEGGRRRTCRDEANNAFTRSEDLEGDGYGPKFCAAGGRGAALTVGTHTLSGRERIVHGSERFVRPSKTACRGRTHSESSTRFGGSPLRRGRFAAGKQDPQVCAAVEIDVDYRARLFSCSRIELVGQVDLVIEISVRLAPDETPTLVRLLNVRSAVEVRVDTFPEERTAIVVVLPAIGTAVSVNVLRAKMDRGRRDTDAAGQRDQQADEDQAIPHSNRSHTEFS
jgi:hypothetical protein